MRAFKENWLHITGMVKQVNPDEQNFRLKKSFRVSISVSMLLIITPLIYRVLEGFYNLSDSTTLYKLKYFVMCFNFCLFPDHNQVFCVSVY